MTTKVYVYLVPGGRGTAAGSNEVNGLRPTSRPTGCAYSNTCNFANFSMIRFSGAGRSLK